MPSNRDKTPCSIPNCRGWAIRGSSPPLCSPHAGRAVPPAGNQNHLVHGYYAQPPDDSASLEAELHFVRAALRRLASIIESGATPGPNPQPLTAADYARYVELTFLGANSVARLLRTRHALDDDGMLSIQAVLDQFASLG